MIKTLTAFRLADHDTRLLLTPEAARIYAEPTVIDPDPTQWSTAGFSRPPEFGNSVVFTNGYDVCLFNVQVRERVLPAKVIKTHLTARAADFEKRQGYVPGRKQMAELKADVIALLLPDAFIKPVDILCMITGDYLMIGAASARLVDIALLQLRGAFPEQPLSIRSIAAGRDARGWLRALLVNGTTVSGKFNTGESVVLKGRDKSVARFKDIDLSSQPVVDSLTDTTGVAEIAITYNERVTFALSDQLVIKRIRFSDVLLRQVDDDTGEGNAVVRFDATVALVAGEMRALVDDLLNEIPDEEEL